MIDPTTLITDDKLTIATARLRLRPMRARRRRGALPRLLRRAGDALLVVAAARLAAADRRGHRARAGRLHGRRRHRVGDHARRRRHRRRQDRPLALAARALALGGRLHPAPRSVGPGASPPRRSPPSSTGASARLELHSIEAQLDAENVGVAAHARARRLPARGAACASRTSTGTTYRDTLVYGLLARRARADSRIRSSRAPSRVPSTAREEVPHASVVAVTVAMVSWRSPRRSAGGAGVRTRSTSCPISPGTPSSPTRTWSTHGASPRSPTQPVVGGQQRQRHGHALRRRRRAAVAHRDVPGVADGSGVLRRRQVHRLRHARPHGAGALHLRRRGRHRLGVEPGGAAAAAVDAGVRHVRRQRRGRRLQGARHRHRPHGAHAPVRHRLPQRARRRARRRVQRGRARQATPSATIALPCGYAPFGIAAFGHRIFVTYALQDADSTTTSRRPATASSTSTISRATSSAASPRAARSTRRGG